VQQYSTTLTPSTKRTKQNKAKQNKTKQSKAKQNKTKQNKTNRSATVIMTRHRGWYVSVISSGVQT
jgi:hypothetical protein